MEFKHYENIGSFIGETFPAVMEAEAQNNLLIANAEAIRDHEASDFFACSVKDEGQVALTALFLPPFPLMLYETANRRNSLARKLLARELIRAGIPVTGALAEQELADGFAGEYAAAAGKAFRSFVKMNVMVCTKVQELCEPSGALRPLREDDLYFSPYWEEAFSGECSVTPTTLESRIEAQKKRIPKRTHFIWQDRVPVSQAVNGRCTPNGAMINGVYTPPLYRGKGYATACVGSLTRRLLESGKEFCCLFADAKNPISNAVYQKIGYRNICVYQEIHFEQENDHVQS